MREDRAIEHERTARLLRQVLPSERWDTVDFLEWVYDHNPVGESIEVNADEGDDRVLHIGGVPLQFQAPSSEGRLLILFNSSTAPSQQGKGTYVKGLYETAMRAREAGFVGAFGVTNAASTGPARKLKGLRFLGVLQARLCVPVALPAKRYEHHLASPEYLVSPAFEEVAADLDCGPLSGWTHKWGPDVLRWRLSWPGRSYWFHVGPDVVAVSTKTIWHGVPIGVLLKVIPRRGAPSTVTSDRLLASICWYHRVPALAYAGFNGRVPVRGFRLRQDRLPSPLNLQFLSSSDELDVDTFAFETFEFLDFDAY